MEKILRAHGRSLDPALADETPPELTADDPTLAACYAAAAQGIGLSGDRAGLPPLRLITPPPDRPRARDVTHAPIAEVRGINVHAAQVVDGRDRRRVERLCRYITRPPIAQERLERRSDGKLELTFKKPWRDDPGEPPTGRRGAAPAPWCSSPRIPCDGQKSRPAVRTSRVCWQSTVLGRGHLPHNLEHVGFQSS